MLTEIFSIGKLKLLFDTQNQRFDTETNVFQTVEMANAYSIAKWQAVDDVKEWDGLIEDNVFDTEIVSMSMNQLIGLPEYSQVFSSAYDGLEDEERLSVWLDAYSFALNHIYAN